MVSGPRQVSVWKDENLFPGGASGIPGESEVR